MRAIRSILMAKMLLVGVPLGAAAQGDDPPDPDAIQYGTLSGNAFGLFNDTEGDGVEVVAFGPGTVEDAYGVVFRNFTDVPVYSINLDGTVRGDEGETAASIGETAAPLGVPSGGFAIAWAPLLSDDPLGDDAELDAEVTYEEEPPAGDQPRLPIPVAEVTQDDDILIATVDNGYPVDLYAPLLDLICFDADAEIVGAYGAVPSDEALLTRSIPSGDTAEFEFEITGEGGCDYFFVAGVGLDDTTDAQGTEPITNDPQFVSDTEIRSPSAMSVKRRRTLSPQGLWVTCSLLIEGMASHKG